MALDEFGTTAVIVGVAELLRPVVLEAGRSTGPGARTKPAKPAATPKKTNEKKKTEDSMPKDDKKADEKKK